MGCSFVFGARFLGCTFVFGARFLGCMFVFGARFLRCRYLRMFVISPFLYSLFARMVKVTCSRLFCMFIC